LDKVKGDFFAANIEFNFLCFLSIFAQPVFDHEKYGEIEAAGVLV
jgi:hypothetical protein